MPAFRSGKPRVRVSASADVAFAAGFHQLPFDVINHEEPAGLWDGSAFTASRPGAYLCTAIVQRRPIAVSSGVTAQLRIGATIVSSLIGPATAAVVAVQLSDVLELAEGDVLSLWGQGSATLGWSLGFSQSRLAVVRVGPQLWTG